LIECIQECTFLLWNGKNQKIAEGDLKKEMLSANG